MKIKLLVLSLLLILSSCVSPYKEILVCMRKSDNKIVTVQRKFEDESIYIIIDEIINKKAFDKEYKILFDHKSKH